MIFPNKVFSIWNWRSIDPQRLHIIKWTNMNEISRQSASVWCTDLLWTATWRSTHFVYGCTVITTSTLSPYETHASSQNSLSSSQSHALLMTRPERDSETHTVSQCNGWQPWERSCERTLVCVCVCVTKQVGWTPSVISCVNCHWTNGKAADDRKAAIGSFLPLSSWQQPLWPTTTSGASSVFFCFLLNITFCMCDAIISSFCWRNTLQWSPQPASTHSKLLQRAQLCNIHFPYLNINNNQRDQCLLVRRRSAESLRGHLAFKRINSCITFFKLVYTFYRK